MAAGPAPTPSPTLEAEQAFAKAAIEARPDTSGRFSQAHIDNLSDRMVETVQEQGGVEALKLAEDPVTQETTKKTFIDQVGDATRKGRVRKEVDLISQYLKEGYSRQSIPRKADRTRLRDILERVIDRSPALAAQLPTDPEQRRIRLEQYLKNPKYANELHELFGEVLDGDEYRRPDEISPDQIQEAKDQQQFAEFSYHKAQDKATRLKNEHDNIDAELARYEDRRGEGEAQGDLHQELEQKLANKATTENELKNWKQVRQGLETDLNALRREKATSEGYLQRRGSLAAGMRTPDEIQADIVQAEKDLNNAKTEETTRQSELDRIKQLEAKRDELKRERDAAADARDEAQIAAKKAENEFKKAERKVKSLEAEVVRFEEAVEQKISNIFSEAAVKFVNGKIEVYMEQLNTQLEEKRAKAKDKQEQLLDDILRHQFTDEEEVYKSSWAKRVARLIGEDPDKTRVIIKKKQIKEDSDKLIREGPLELAKQYLSGEINPETGINFTDDEIESLLSRNENAMQNEIVNQVLARRLLIGDVSDAELHTIVMSRWGRGRLQKAYETNKEFQQALDQASEAEVTKKEGIFATLNKMIGSKTGKTLLLSLLLMSMGLKQIEDEETFSKRYSPI